MKLIKINKSRIKNTCKKVVTLGLASVLALVNVVIPVSASDTVEFDIILNSEVGCELKTDKYSAKVGELITIDVNYETTFDFEGVELVGSVSGDYIEYENSSDCMWFEMPSESVIVTPVGFDISDEINMKEIQNVMSISLDSNSTSFNDLGDYILEKSDSSYVTVNENATPVAPFSTMQTYATESDFPSNIDEYSITNLYSESIVTGVTPFVLSSTLHTYLFELDSEDDYYVAFVDASMFSKNVNLVDYEYARTNVNGEIVEGCIFDETTGLVYVSKTLYSELEDSTDNEQYVRMQLLYVYEESNSELNTPVMITGDGLTKGFYSTGMVTLDINDFVTTVKIAEPGTDLPDNTIVLVNGVPKYDKDSYIYDIDNGSIIIKEPSMGITSLTIFVDEVSAISTFGLSSTGSDWNTVSGLTMTTTSALSRNDAFTISNQMFQSTGSADEVDNASAAYAPLGSSDYVLQESTMGEVIKKVYNGTSITHSNYTYTIKSSLLNSLWYPNTGTSTSTSSSWYGRGFKSSATTTSGGNKITFIGSAQIPFYCIHNTLPNANRSEDIKTSTTGIQRWQLDLRGIVASVNTSSGYAVIALAHESISTQAGLVYIRIKTEPLAGNLALKKVSSCPSVSSGNQFYSLAGATYGLYTSAWDSLDDSNRKGTFTTNASGTSNTITGLDPGTYYVKELTAPEGFKIDSTTHTVIVSAGQTNTFTVYEDPITDPVSLFLSKKDPYLGYTPQGDTSLEGAVFQFDFYADYLTTADIKTGSYSPIISFKAETKLLLNPATNLYDPMISLAQKYGCIIESSFSSTTGATLAGLYDEDGDLALPMGSLAVYEVDAPEGYTTDGYTMEEYDIDGNPITGSFTTDGIVVMQIDPEGNHTSSIQVHNQILVTETGMFRTGFNGMKLDSETASQFPQGDASLAGAVINVENASENAIVILGDTDDDYEIFEPGETIFQLETIEDGTFASDMEALPLGTYILTEDSAPEGYLMNEDWSRTFTIREGDDPVSISLTDTPLSDQVIRGGVSITKYDKELEQSSAIGLDEAGTIKPDSPTLIGIAFDIKNVGENRVMVEGVSYEPGEVVKTIYSYYDEASKSYIAKTENDLLPYGNYEIQEAQTVDGYLLTDTTPRKFFIENEGEIVTHDTSGTEMIFSNQVIRGDFSFMKIEGDTSSRMQTLWTVENTTTGEIHTLATDKNGEFYSSADDGFAHTKDTNANDFLLDRIANGETISISEVNQSAGLWFGLSDNGSVAKPNDSLGALPYGLYTLSEVRTDTNEGLDLKTIQFYIYRDSRTVDLGTLTNVIRDIVTDAYDAETGLQYGSRREDAILIDKVTYKGFDRNTEYTVVGNLVDTATGGFILDHMGDVLEVTHKFTTTSGDGYENVEFVFDSRQVNEAVVVFQTVYDSYGNKISEHRDIDEARQTVVYPRLETYASADSTGSNIVNADGTVTFTDRVLYEGLTRGDKYTLKAVLMNRELGDELLDKDGNEVTAELEFIAEQADGEVEISVTFDITGLEGTEAVFFETLYDIEGVIIGEHKDIDDENQIVNVPSVSTQATYLATSSNMGGLSTHAIIDDEAAYKAVALDMNYKMSGILMDKATGEVYKTTSGEEVTSELEFTPVEKEGSVVLRFELDSMLLGGQDLVVFETLYAEIEGEYVEVASHRDIDDVNQTISFPGVTTEAYTKSTGTHMSKIQEYVLSEEPTEDEDLDVEENEDLDTEENEDELDSEEDNSNEEESIMTVESDAPDDLPSGLEEDKEYLDSLLPNEDSELEEDTDVEEEEEQGPVYVPIENLTDVFYDTVTYNGLTPGLEYTVKGSLIDKATGTMAFADGLAEMVFTPEEADGELIMEFPEVLIKDILGMHVVVFEEIYLGDDLIASHTDIDSTTQSIYILEIDTKATGSNLTAKTVELGTKVKVVDTITHPYIDVDQTYRVESQLIRKSTGDVISEVTTSYTPTASNGSVGITFTVDTSDYLNEELVAFQTVYDMNDNIVGEHKDIDDADQTVLVTDKIVVQTGLSGNIALMLSLISLILVSLGGYALHIKKMRKSLK